MVPSLILIILDQAVQSVRTLWIHWTGKKGGGLRCEEAKISAFGMQREGAVVRLEFEWEHSGWKTGQHFMLTFAALSLWRSHPFTPVSLPEAGKKVQKHVYLIRVGSGQTAKLAALGDCANVSVILTGRYGRACPSEDARTVLAVVGGTGISFALPVVLKSLRRRQQIRHVDLEKDELGIVELVWVVKRVEYLLWLEEEIMELRRLVTEHDDFRVRIFVTREAEDDSLSHQSSDNENDFEMEKSEVDEGPSGAGIVKRLLYPLPERFSVDFLGGRRPSMGEAVGSFMARSDIEGVGADISGSGPEEMGSDLRDAVAGSRDCRRLKFYWDSR
jgi:NAD(P)H-flavin reductase